MARKKSPRQQPERTTAADDELLTTAEVAARLKVTRQTVQRLINAGNLVASRVGREWRVKRSELDAFLKAFQNR
jgi:excisionase family DNA binding protein